MPCTEAMKVCACVLHKFSIEDENLTIAGMYETAQDLLMEEIKEHSDWHNNGFKWNIWDDLIDHTYEEVQEAVVEAIIESKDAVIFNHSAI